jgi:hypothetical protein
MKQKNKADSRVFSMGRSDLPFTIHNYWLRWYSASMMKKKYMSVGLSLLALTGIIIGIALWGQAFYVFIQNYRSPLHEVSLPPQPPLAPQNTHKMVVVLIGGLGYDASQALDLPVFNQLRGAGLIAVQHAAFLLTNPGPPDNRAPPETNDAPPVDLAWGFTFLEVDTLFLRP